MIPQSITTLPFGFDEQTTIALTERNEVVIAHPVMPAMIYDESVMRWVELLDIAPAVIQTAKVPGFAGANPGAGCNHQASGAL